MNKFTITEAEWQIMRVLWENNPATSADIITALKQGPSWSPTTIKTFLARLVEKQIVGFEPCGRGYSYFPLRSEYECVKQEMADVIRKTYGGILRYETDHFLFYGEDSPTYSQFLATALEEGYQRISRRYRHQPADKMIVYLYSSQRRLFSALGVQTAPKWLRAGWQWEILHIAPADCFDDIPADRVAVHVMTQILLYQMNPAIPMWLHQGVAAYESQWLTPTRIGETLQSGGGLFTSFFRPMQPENYETFKESGGYELSYAIVEFILSEFGVDRLIRLVKATDSLPDIFGCDENAFWERCRQSVTDRYQIKAETTR